MVGLKSEIFAFIADNFTVEVLLQNLWTTLYFESDRACSSALNRIRLRHCWWRSGGGQRWNDR